MLLVHGSWQTTKCPSNHFSTHLDDDTWNKHFPFSDLYRYNVLQLLANLMLLTNIIRDIIFTQFALWIIASSDRKWETIFNEATSGSVVMSFFVHWTVIIPVLSTGYATLHPRDCGSLILSNDKLLELDQEMPDFLHITLGCHRWWRGFDLMKAYLMGVICPLVQLARTAYITQHILRINKS